MSRREKIIQAAATWLAMAVVSIPLCDAISNLPFCLFTPPGLAEIHICLPVVTIVSALENWLGPKRDFGSIVAHYWPVSLTASAFTVLLLRSWWRRS